MKIFCGNAHSDLGQKICSYLDVTPGEIEVRAFPDGEINVAIKEDIRGNDIFILQPTCHPVNENIMELLIIIDAFKRSSAKRVTAVIPYFGYARQDRKHEGRVPITAKLVANLLCSAGAERLLTIDLHSSQIQGFFDIPVDHLFAAPVLIDYIKTKNLKNMCVVAPDPGSIKMSNAFAKRLDADFAIVDKRRTGDTRVEVNNVVGDVKGKNVIFVDDMIATGTSLVSAYNLVMERGPASVHIVATHAVLCGKAVENFKGLGIEEIIVTDSIPTDDKDIDNLVVLSLDKLIGESIRRIHNNQSLSSLFI